MGYSSRHVVIGSRPSYWEQWSSVIGFWTCESPGGDCPCSRDTRVPGTGVMELDPGKLRCRRYPMVARPSHLRPSDSATLRFGIWGMWFYLCLDIVLDTDAVSAAAACRVFRQPTWHHLAALCSVDRASHGTDQNRTSRLELLSTQVVATGDSHG